MFCIFCCEEPERCYAMVVLLLSGSIVSENRVASCGKYNDARNVVYGRAWLLCDAEQYKQMQHSECCMISSNPSSVLPALASRSSVRLSSHIELLSVWQKIGKHYKF